ncbi:hypothetical protein CRH09_35820 [Nocardia terpenica]|uniref:Uncharacterized protein n=1 Tax=Nocardia terpenica TaxID=455432 RepID=A0A291RTT7_9NOCA|nr:hypothetical protein CRH09_35820 [Nocardia terpenica]
MLCPVDTRNQPPHHRSIWLDWLRDVSGRASAATLGAAIGRSPSYAERHLRVANPSPEAVVAFAHAFDQNPAHALRKAGYLSAGEVMADAATLDMQDMSTYDLASLALAATTEMHRRMRENGQPQQGSLVTRGEHDTTSSTPEDGTRQPDTGKGRRRLSKAELRRGMLR